MAIAEILNYFFGSTTLVSIYIAFKSRKSEIKKAEANALQTIQGVYDKFTSDTNQRYDAMRSEINTLKDENKELKLMIGKMEIQVETYKTTCARCVSNKQMA